MKNEWEQGVRIQSARRLAVKRDRVCHVTPTRPPERDPPPGSETKAEEAFSGSGLDGVSGRRRVARCGRNEYISTTIDGSAVIHYFNRSHGQRKHIGRSPTVQYNQSTCKGN